MTLASTSKMVDQTKRPILLFMVELGGRDRTRIDPQLKIPGEHQATPKRLCYGDSLPSTCRSVGPTTHATHVCRSDVSAAVEVEMKRKSVGLRLRNLQC